jgi:hypothetical protein
MTASLVLPLLDRLVNVKYNNVEQKILNPLETANASQAGVSQEGAFLSEERIDLRKP